MTMSRGTGTRPILSIAARLRETTWTDPECEVSAGKSAEIPMSISISPSSETPRRLTFPAYMAKPTSTAGEKDMYP